MADHMTDEPFNLVPFDGILGLGMPKMSVPPMFNLMGELAEDNALKHNQYSIWLARDGDGEDSEIIFGDMDPDRLSSQIIWLPISSLDSGFWQIAVQDVAVNDGKLASASMAARPRRTPAPRRSACRRTCTRRSRSRHPCARTAAASTRCRSSASSWTGTC